MLLRRITKHVQDQNWFAVGIDFAIVVIGVFVGFQVANWNEARADVERSTALKLRLIQDFRTIEQKATEHIDSILAWQATSQAVRNEILAGTLSPSQAGLTERLSDASSWTLPPGRSVTFTEIVSQGDMDILKSTDLRDALLEFDAFSIQHHESNLALIETFMEELDFMSGLNAILSIPEDQYRSDFASNLEADLNGQDLYIAVYEFANARDIDLTYQRRTRAHACAVLKALEQTCADVETDETEPNP